MSSKESKQVIKFREKHLAQGENIAGWVDAQIGELGGKGDKEIHIGVAIVTDNRVIFYYKGLLSEILKAIPLKNIVSVDRESSLLHQVVKLRASNTELEIKTFNKKDLEQIANLIDTCWKNVGVTSPEPAKKSSSSNDALDKIKKLAELRDLGTITIQEFNEKKEQLLAAV